MKSSRESDKPIIRIGKNVRNNDRIVDDRAVASSSSGQNRSEAFDTDSNSPSPIATKKRDFTEASIGIARDDNYSEEDSMSCTNCTDYSEDDISMKELDQLTHIGKFLAGMRQQHTTGGRERAAIEEGKVQHYNKRRGSEDELRRRRENDGRNFKRENESSRSKFEYGRDRVITNKDKSIEGDMRGFVSLEGHVTRCEITKSLNETSSSSYKYIVERRISRSNSEQEKGLLRSYSHQSHGREDKEKLNFDKEEFLGIGRNELVLQRNISHCKPILEPIHCAHSNTTSPTRSSGVLAMSHRRNTSYTQERTPPPPFINRSYQKKHYSGSHERDHDVHHSSRTQMNDIVQHNSRLPPREHDSNHLEDPVRKNSNHDLYFHSRDAKYFRHHSQDQSGPAPRDHDNTSEHIKDHDHKSSRSHMFSRRNSEYFRNDPEFENYHTKDIDNHNSRMSMTRNVDLPRGKGQGHPHLHHKHSGHHSQDSNYLQEDPHLNCDREEEFSRSLKSQNSVADLGFPDLCRFFYRELRKRHNDVLSNKVSTMMIECWQKNNYLYSDLEEMYLINMQSNQDRELLVRELVSTIGGNRELLPKEISQYDLVNLTIDFFNSEPVICDKLDKISQEKVVYSDRYSLEDNNRGKRGGKYEGLKPVTTCIESILLSAGLSKPQCTSLAGDITERFVIASFTWEKMLQYHSRGRDKFTKKCIPHVFMSKDDFPKDLTSEEVLDQLFDMIENWKNKLFDALSVDKAGVTERETPTRHLNKELDHHRNVNKKEENFEERYNKEYDNKKSRSRSKEDFKNKHDMILKVDEDYETKRKNILAEAKMSLKSREEKELNNKSPSVEILKDRKESSSYEYKKKDFNEKSFDTETPKENTLNNDMTMKSIDTDDIKSFPDIKSDNQSLLNRVNRILDIAKTLYPPANPGNSTNDVNKTGKSYNKEKHDSSDESQDESEKTKSNYQDSSVVTRTLEDGELRHSDTEATVDDVDDIILDDSDAIKPTKRKVIVLKKGEQFKPLTDDSAEIKSKRRRKRLSSASSSSSESRSRSRSKPSAYDIKKLSPYNDNIVEPGYSKNLNSLQRRSRSDSRSVSELLKRARSFSPRMMDIKRERSKSIQSCADITSRLGERNDGKFRQGSTTYYRSLSEERKQHRNSSRSRQQSSSSHRHRSLSRDRQYKGRSRERSKGEHKRRHRSRGRDEKKRYRSRSRDGHRSSHKHSSTHNSHHSRRHRSRSFSPNRVTRWVPICPCEMTSTVDILPMGYITVRIGIKAEFVYDENIGCQVRMTKWTGKDMYDNANVRDLVVRPQIVTIDEDNCLEIEVHNPSKDKKLYLKKYDKVACLQILSVPFERRSFAHEKHIERAVDGNKKWFRVTNVVMQRRGTLEKISIFPNKQMKLIASIFGPIRKYRGKEILITRLSGNKEFYVPSQIVKICDNENVGFTVTNDSKSTLIIYKSGQDVATLCVWANVSL